MKKDGPPPASLSERLRARIESEKAAVEAHHSQIAATMAAERSRLAESLKAESERALNAMRQLTDETIAQTQRSNEFSRQAMDALAAQIRVRSSEALRGIRPTILLSVIVVSSAVAVLLGTSWWTARSLEATRGALAIERQALSDLRELTGRVRIYRSANGLFVMMPEGTETGWRCENAVCAKLPED